MSGEPLSVLIVEDEKDIAELLRYNLERSGFKTLIAYDGAEGLNFAQSACPGVILLDWMLPGLSGVEICRKLRENHATRNIPIIMLTSKGEEADKIAGLNVGADDYVTKPFSPAELIARIGAVLRRTNHKAQVRTLKVGPLLLDFTQRRASNNGAEIHLGPTEFRLLHHFMQHPGEVFSREQLLEQVWDKDIYVELRTVDVHIRRLRKALGDDNDAGLIRTVRLAGYALDVPTS